MTLLVGVDLGTSRIRALLVDPEGRVLAEAARPTPWFAPLPGRFSYDPETLWSTAAAVLAEITAAAPAGAVAGVAVASVGESAVLIDAAGRPLAPAIAWFDRRSASEAAALAEVAAAALLPPDPTYTLAKLGWMRAHEPGFPAARRWLHLADWIGFRLTGEAATDFTLASRTQALDLAAGTWNQPLLDRLGLAALAPPLRPAGSPLGRVGAAAAAATGLPSGTAVAVGGHDHLCGALVAGATRAGVLLDSLGTAEALLRTLPAPLADPAVPARGFAQGRIRVAPDLDLAYLLAAIPASGGSVAWFRESLAGGADHAALTAEAAAVAPGAEGVVFLPPRALAGTEEAGGAFLGLNPERGRGALYRAVLEGLACESRLLLEAMEALPGLGPATEIRVTGGLSRNPLFLAIKAAVLGRPLLRLAEAEGTALGAALLAGIAAGVWPDLATARARFAPSAEAIPPDPAWVHSYDKFFTGRFRHLHSRLAP